MEVKLHYFKHDLKATQDIKIQRLISARGRAALATFWALLEYCYLGEGEVVLSDDFISEFTFLLKIDQVELLAEIDTMASIGLVSMHAMQIHAKECKVIRSNRVQNEIGAIVGTKKSISEQRQAAANKRWGKHANMQNDARASVCNAPASMQNARASVCNAKHANIDLDLKLELERELDSRAREDTHAEESSENQEEEIDETNTVLGSQPNIVRTPEKSADFERAERQLIEATGSQDWEFENSFMLLGKRPLKKYARIFLSVPELVSIQEKYRAAGVLEDLKTAAHLVDARLDEWDLKGKNYKNTNLYIWFISWALNDCIDQKEKRDRQNKYINNTNGKQPEPQRRSLPTAEETKNLIAGLVSLKTMQ